MLEEGAHSRVGREIGKPGHEDRRAAPADVSQERLIDLGVLLLGHGRVGDENRGRRMAERASRAR
jgi:hypothetical protein